MRLIDVDALIAEIEKRRKAAKTLTGIDMVMLLKDAPTVNGWISAKDRLSDKNEEVIICYEWTGDSGNTYREIACTTMKECEMYGNRVRIISWMPIPEPPKEDKDDA